MDAMSSPAPTLPGPQQGELLGSVRPELPGFVSQFTPMQLANQVAQMGSQLRRTVLRALFGGAIWTAIWWWQRANWGSPWWLLLGWSVSLVMLAVTLVQMILARRALARIVTGEALRATADGLVLHQLDHSRRELPWQLVQAVRLEGHDFAVGPKIKVTVAREHAELVGAPARRWWQRRTAPAVVWQMPLYYLDALPGTIDGALRAFSQGSHGLDVTGLDSFW